MFYSTVTKIIGLLLVAGSCFSSEFCTLNQISYCPDYCCGSSKLQYCCSTCSFSINYHSECAPFYISVGTIVAYIISLIVFIVIISFIVAICCGCICSNRTGIQRRGRIIRSGPPNVTILTTGNSGYPTQSPIYPQSNYGAIYPAQDSPPQYPANYNYGVPPKYSAGYVYDQK